MSTEEMDIQMDVLYNNITSNQAPGLNTHEKSLFLTKAQDELLKNYFNPKGNKYGEGFDGSRKRQIDFSAITVVDTPAISFGEHLFDPRPNTSIITLPTDVWMIINEHVTVFRRNMATELTVVPLRLDEYDRLMSKPYKRPLKYQAWRLINADGTNKADLIIGPEDDGPTYTIRYIRKPRPIVLGYLDGLTIEGVGDVSECELDPILHQEIVQRAVELAKIAWTNTGQDNIQAVLQGGQRSE